MTSVLHRRMGGLAVLTLMLAMALPVWAQNNNITPPPFVHRGEQSDAGGDHWGKEGFEQQNLREEMEQIRKEHEELEEARDHLLDRCMNVSNEQAEQCKKERAELRERGEKLHSRMQTLHEKMEELRKERDERRGEYHDEHGGQQGQGAPQADNDAHRPPPQNTTPKNTPPVP